MIRTRAVLIMVTLGLSLAAVGSAAAEEYRYKIVGTDEAAARLAVLARADINPFTGWKGGPQKPHRTSSDQDCRTFHPRRSDLVITGDAASEFIHQSGAYISMTATVFKTSKMTETAWRRELLAPGSEACLRSATAASFGTLARMISFKRLAFPRRGSHTLAYRTKLRVNGGGETLVDMVFYSDGRGVGSLVQALPNTPATGNALLQADVQIVTALATRLALAR